VAQFFATHVGDRSSTPKRAERTARLLQEQFMADGWPTGQYYGSEMELAHSWQVGYLIIREAARILEAHQTARIRRGRIGGLELTVPSLASLLATFRQYFAYVGLTRQQWCVAQSVLGRVNPQGSGSPSTSSPAASAVADVLSHCLMALQDLTRKTGRALKPSLTPVPLAGLTLANDLARRLVAGSRTEDWRSGLILGTEPALCDRYRVDRRVMRQAIRILESQDIVATMPGRAGGLVTREPGQAAITRLLCCYFAASRLDYHETFQVYRKLSVEVASLLAQQVEASEVRPLRARLAAMLRKPSECLSIVHVSAIDDAVHALLRNPVLELFLRTTRAFPAWAHYRESIRLPTHRQFHELLASMAEILAAIESGDAAGAAAAQDHRLMAVASWRFL
jgi:DNA-binding FadR family transcriptional regulator